MPTINERLKSRRLVELEIRMKHWGLRIVPNDGYNYEVFLNENYHNYYCNKMRFKDIKNLCETILAKG